MSDFMAYDGNKEEWVDLRTCSDRDLLSWAESSRMHGDQVVLRDCITLLDDRGVPHSYERGGNLSGPAAHLLRKLQSLDHIGGVARCNLPHIGSSDEAGEQLVAAELAEWQPHPDDTGNREVDLLILTEENQ